MLNLGSRRPCRKESYPGNDSDVHLPQRLPLERGILLGGHVGQLDSRTSTLFGKVLEVPEFIFVVTRFERCAVVRLGSRQVGRDALGVHRLGLHRSRMLFYKDRYKNWIFGDSVSQAIIMSSHLTCAINRPKYVNQPITTCPFLRSLGLLYLLASAKRDQPVRKDSLARNARISFSGPESLV